jgi:hypothetical protein
MFRFDSAEISDWPVWLPIGDLPGFFEYLIPESGIRGFPELCTVGQVEPLSRTFV